jgi:nicotinamide phosphoribosyltransferase
VVIRPDSGDPEKVCGRLVEILGNKFGYTVNSKGYKVLNNVRLIQGDGVNQRTIHNILGHFKVYGWSADNISFGIGGALLQQLDRDTQKFAMKCSAARVNGEWRDVFKDPVTDSGKTSKRGKVTLYKDGKGGYFTDLEGRSEEEALVTVFKDGELFNELTFEQIRANAAK